MKRTGFDLDFPDAIGKSNRVPIPFGTTAES